MHRKHPAPEHSAAVGRCQGSGAVSLHQHDAPHRPTGDALDRSATRPARPAQPSWRMRLMISWFVRCRCSEWTSLTIWTLPQPSHLMRMNNDGNALNGSSSASAGVGRGSLP